MKNFISSLTLVAFMVATALSASAEQRQCPRCHSLGRVQVSGQMSNFGSPTPRYCRECNVTYTGDHWHVCPQCHGSGHIESRERRHYTEDRMEEAQANFINLLTPDEYQYYTQLVQALMPQPQQLPCNSCNGSGKCAVCGGAFTFNVMLDVPQCIACGGSGVCIVCRGSGRSGEFIMVDPPNKEWIQQQILELNQRAYQRDLQRRR